MAQKLRNHLPMQETWELQVQSLGREDLLEEEMATYSNILAWKNPMDIGTWQATVHGASKNWTQLSNWACRAMGRLSGGGWGPEPLLQLEQLHISLFFFFFLFLSWGSTQNHVEKKGSACLKEWFKKYIPTFSQPLPTPPVISLSHLTVWTEVWEDRIISSSWSSIS